MEQPKPLRQRRSRADGWTPDRQLRFLDALETTRSVSRAAKAAGMSRNSAYRFRERRDGALFAALWDRILAPHFADVPKVDIGQLGNGALLRLLGNHYRRESGEFGEFARRSAEARRR